MHYGTLHRISIIVFYTLASSSGYTVVLLILHGGQIKSNDEDAINEDMEDYVESNQFIVFANATPEIKRVIISLVSLGIFIFNLINAVGFT